MPTIPEYNRLVPATADGHMLPLVVDTLRGDLAKDTGWTLGFGWRFTSNWAQGAALNWWQPFAIKHHDNWVSMQGIVNRLSTDVPAGTIFGVLPETWRPSRTWIDGNIRVDPSGYCSIQEPAKVGPVALWGRFQIV